MVDTYAVAGGTGACDGGRGKKVLFGIKKNLESPSHSIPFSAKRASHSRSIPSVRLRLPPPLTKGRQNGYASTYITFSLKGNFLTPTTNACGVGPPSKEEGVMGASSEIRFSLKEVLLTPTTNRVAVGPPSPSKGEGAIYAHRFLGRNIRELLCDRKVIKRGCATFVPPLSKGRWRGVFGRRDGRDWPGV